MIDVTAILGGGYYNVDVKIFFYNSNKLRASIYINDFRIDCPYFLKKIEDYIKFEKFPTHTRIHREAGDTFLQVDDSDSFSILKDTLASKMGAVAYTVKKRAIHCIKVNINDLITVFENLSKNSDKPEINSVEDYLDWKIKLQ